MGKEFLGDLRKGGPGINTPEARRTWVLTHKKSRRKSYLAKSEKRLKKEVHWGHS